MLLFFNLVKARRKKKNEASAHRLLLTCFLFGGNPLISHFRLIPINFLAVWNSKTEIIDNPVLLLPPTPTSKLLKHKQEFRIYSAFFIHYTLAISEQFISKSKI